MIENQSKWVSDSTIAQFVNGVSEMNNIHAHDLGLNLDGFYTDAHLNRIRDWVDNGIMEEHNYSFWMVQEDGNDVVVQWPIPLNFSYSTSSIAYTQASGGFPVGNLNVFPDKKAEWIAQGSVIPDVLDPDVEPPGPESDNVIGITETGGVAGDTVSVSVYVELVDEYPLNGFSVTVAGLGGGNITAVGVDTAGTIMTSDWLWSYFITDSGNVVITAGAGAESVEAMGSLFNVHFVIDESSEGGFYPVFITDALFNEDEDMDYEMSPGGVGVLGIGDVSANGNITALDASLILQHLVGLDTLSGDQQSVGDVTGDNSLSALDAAVILDHVVGLVDELPYSPTTASMQAMIAISGGATEPGSTFEVPIRLTDGTNVRSFELEFSYDVEALSVEQIVWDTEVLSGVQVLDNQQDGVVKVSAAGMGSSLASGSQTLGYIEFRMDDFFDDYQTSITLSRSRVNELDAVIEGSVALYTNSTLVVSDWGDGGVPVEFALNQNYPNPFNPSTMIRYQLPEQTMVTIAIYDLMGRKVRTLIPGETQLAGYRQVIWNATNDYGQPVSAGMYIYTIQAGEFRQTKKMVLMK